jgi:carboxypeptidase C (cathepsin A)
VNLSASIRRVAFGLAIAFALPIAGAQEGSSTSDVVVTHHQATVSGKVLRYTARAGFIPIRDNEAGEIHANLFFIAYALDGAAKNRPVTFLWNGGPGSNSGLVHLLGFGPKRIVAATGNMPRYSSAGTALVDNPDTWLTVSDLVFVDPIGTGYSRPTKAEYSAEFYQGPGDAESVAEFIRVYRNRYDLADAPLFLMGESYGVTRASLVSEALERRRTRVNGVILLSGGFPLPGDVSPAVRAALALPSYTAAAYTNHKLPADLQRLGIQEAITASKSYALGDYAAALARGDSLSSTERDAVTRQLARFTGLPASEVNKDLRLSIEQISNTLLGQAMMVGHYDSRAVGPRDTTQTMYDPTTDPSLKDILEGASVVRYMREELGFKSDMFYQGPFGGGYPPPASFRGDWMSVRWGRGQTPASAEPTAQGARGGGRGRGGPQTAQGLAAATTADPSLQVFVACGYFDLGGNCFVSEYTAAHVLPDLARRVTARVYGGGHATYTDDTARRQLVADVTKFIQSAAVK